MKECRNLTVWDFKSSNVLAWRSLPVMEISRFSGSKECRHDVSGRTLHLKLGAFITGRMLLLPSMILGGLVV